MNQSDTKMTWHNLLAIFVSKHLQYPLRALPDKAFSYPKCSKCRYVARLRPDPLGQLTAALKLLTPSALDPRPHLVIAVWAMTKSSSVFSRKNRLTPSVAAPDDTNPGDAFGHRYYRFK